MTASLKTVIYPVSNLAQAKAVYSTLLWALHPPWMSRITSTSTP